MVGALAREEKPIVKHCELLRVMKLMETIFHSAESGQVINEII
jgi:hypothetical protein